MTIPKECKMPDLSDLTRNKLIPSYIISSLAGADRDLDKKFILYRKIFIRLVDKAIDEYLLVPKAVINQIHAKSGEIYIFSAIDHLENCINSFRRLFYLFDRIIKYICEYYNSVMFKVFKDTNDLIDSENLKTYIKYLNIDGRNTPYYIC